MTNSAENEDLALINDLLDWSLDISDLESEIENRHFPGYLSWEVPLPFDLLEKNQRNRGLRSFCVERMIYKMINLHKHIKFKLKNLSFSQQPLRTYSIINSKNVFHSEVGVIFSQEDWDFMVHRNIKTENFEEKTEIVDGKIQNEFSVFIPNEVRQLHLFRTVDDKADAISDSWNFYAAWIEC